MTGICVLPIKKEDCFITRDDDEIKRDENCYYTDNSSSNNRRGRFQNRGGYGGRGKWQQRGREKGKFYGGNGREKQSYQRDNTSWKTVNDNERNGNPFGADGAVMRCYECEYVVKRLTGR